MDETNPCKDASGLVTAILDIIDACIQQQTSMAGLDPQRLEADLERQISAFSRTITES